MNKTNPKTNEKEYLSREEELRYIEIAQGKTNASVQEIKEAKDILFANIKDFIQPRVADHAWKFTNNVVDEDDFMSDAYLGFDKALKKFDPARGNRLLTYAISAIDQEMHRDSMRTAYSVSVSSSDCSKHCKGLKLQAQGLPDNEISEHIGCDWGGIKNMSYSCSLQDSLYAGDDGDIIEVGDAVADTNAVTAEQIEAKIDQEETLRKVYALLRTMDPKDVLLTVSDCGYFENDPTLAELCGIAGLETPSGVKKKRDRIRAEIRSSVYRSYNNLPLAG